MEQIQKGGCLDPLHHGAVKQLNGLVGPLSVSGIFARPTLAVAFGVFLALAETVRRWGHWPFLPFLVDDWLAGLFLIYGGLRSRRHWQLGRPYQAAGWAFTCGMLYMSFFGHLEHWSKPSEGGWVPHDALVGIIGALFILALGGLWGTLMIGRRGAPEVQGAKGAA